MLALLKLILLVAAALGCCCTAMGDDEPEPNDEAIFTNKKQNLVSNVAGYSLKTHVCFLTQGTHSLYYI